MRVWSANANPISIVILEELKRRISSNQKGKRSGILSHNWSIVNAAPPVSEGDLTHCVTETEHRNPVRLLYGNPLMREGDGFTGIGGGKKRRVDGNGQHTGFNLTRHESEPTSNWSLMVRAFGESN